MEKLINLLDTHGIPIVITGLVIIIAYKYTTNKILAKKTCIKSKEFEDIKIIVKENRDMLIEIKTMTIQNIMRYKGRNDGN